MHAARSDAILDVDHPPIRHSQDLGAHCGLQVDRMVRRRVPSMSQGAARRLRTEVLAARRERKAELNEREGYDSQVGGGGGGKTAKETGGELGLQINNVGGQVDVPDVAHFHLAGIHHLARLHGHNDGCAYILFLFLSGHIGSTSLQSTFASNAGMANRDKVHPSNLRFVDERQCFRGGLKRELWQPCLLPDPKLAAPFANAVRSQEPRGI